MFKLIDDETLMDDDCEDGDDECENNFNRYMLNDAVGPAPRQEELVKAKHQIQLHRIHWNI